MNYKKLIFLCALMLAIATSLLTGESGGCVTVPGIPEICDEE